jgi:glycerophosphoryl diester phosphodiesterase
MPRVERSGHRGSPRVHLENTLPSFASAFAEGADAIELDVHVTADGIAVVHHDAELGPRVVPGALAGLPIATLTGAQVAAVDLAEGYSIPTLEEVFQAIPAHGMVYVEIKAGSPSPVADVLRRYQGRCAVHSFDHAAIAEFARLEPGIPRGILIERRSDDLAELMRAARARDVWPAWKIVDESLVEVVHQNGGRVIAWTVNQRSSAQELIRIGTDGLCTDELAVI